MSSCHASCSATVSEGYASTPEVVVAVVVTRDRPALLAQCLHMLQQQSRRPDRLLVVDNASGLSTEQAIARFPGVETLRLERNLGGAGGYHAGITAALDMGADWLWLMDDDGRPADAACLGALLAAAGPAIDLSAPLVLDVDAPDRLAFPIRVRRRTLLRAAEVTGLGTVPGFAHLFNGALIRAGLFRRVGLPNACLFIRGDEVEWLLRARRSGAGIVLTTAVHFLHPGSAPEIHPIMGGWFYATLPVDPCKQFFQFRNRAWIFRRYGMWGWLAADVVRYGWFFLARQRDVAGLRAWAAATWTGLRGDLSRGAADAA